MIRKVKPSYAARVVLGRLLRRGLPTVYKKPPSHPSGGDARQAASTVLSAAAGQGGGAAVYAGSPASVAGGGRFAYTSIGKEEAPVESRRMAGAAGRLH